MRWFLISMCLLSGPRFGPLSLSAQELADLPDAPSVHLFNQGFDPVSSASHSLSFAGSLESPVIAVSLPPCTPENAPPPAPTGTGAPPSEDAIPASSHPCAQPPDLYSRFADSTALTPMTVGQKGKLALYNIFEPINLLTIGLTSAFSVGINSHTAYGPGVRGWGRDMGYTFAQEATGEITGTFAISALTHEDPRYHRDPHAPTMKRVLHAISHTYIAQHDDGRPMPNYRVLLGYPLSAETSNLYVPGLATDARSTVKRIGIGIGMNPIEDLITEFLPDVATHIHLRVVLVNRILNKVDAGRSAAE